MKVVIQGTRFDLDISHIESDEEKKLLIIPIMEDAIHIELSPQDIDELKMLSDGVI